MKKVFFALAACLCAVSCGVYSYTLNIPEKLPSESGLHLVSKDLAVVYVSHGLDSTQQRVLADNFACTLEDALFNSQEKVGVYMIPDQDSVGSKESLVNLVLETKSDVVFLLDCPRNKERLQEFDVHLYVYDSMGKDSVYTFGGVISPMQSLSAKLFEPVLKNRYFTFLYIDSEPWLMAAEATTNSDFTNAIKIWLDLTSSRNSLTRSAAAFNLAQTMYILKDYEMAEKWLDSSDSDNKQQYSDELRKKIQEAKNQSQ